MHKLTALQVKNAKPNTKLSDGAGLRLDTDANGNRAWIFRYTSPSTGRERYRGLGSADVVPLVKARELASAAREQVAAGVDPIEARDAARTAAKVDASRGITFQEYAKAYLTAHEGTWKNEDHQRQWKNSLRDYAYPIIGLLPVCEVDTAAVLKVLRPIWQDKPETASRVRGRIEVILSAAKVDELRTGENPALWRGHLDQIFPSKKKMRKVVNHPALPYEDAPAFWRSLKADRSPVARALQWIILTASRLTETAEATGPEVKRGHALWIVPAARMKADRDHRVPLVPAALALVSDPAPAGLLFPAPLTGRVLADTTMAKVIKRHASGTPATTHGFRSTFRDWVGDCTNFPREMGEAALAHAVGDETEAAYRRGDALKKRREMMQAWADYLESGTT